MPTIAQVRQTYRTAIAANTAHTPLLRGLFRSWREAQDEVDALTEATRYLAQTLAGDITATLFHQHMNVIAANLATMPAGPGAGSVRNVRNSLRALLIDPASPDWLKRDVEIRKRTMLVDTNGGGTPKYDQQDTDPIVVAADAALLVLAAPASTPEQLQEAAATIERWREITP